MGNGEAIFSPQIAVRLVNFFAEIRPAAPPQVFPELSDREREILDLIAEYERARNHKWYMTSRLICVNDVYSFDPNAKVSLDDFVDIIGRNFRQPEEGLGLDDSPSAHMWRTMMWPNRFL